MFQLQKISWVLFILIVVIAVFSWGNEETSIESVSIDQIIKHLEDEIGQIARIYTLGGGEFQGKLIAIGDDRIELMNSEGEIIQIAKTELERAIIIDQDLDEAVYYQDASANRLLVMPTAFPMEPGEWHITFQEIIVVTTSYGVSEHFSFWGGISIPGALLNGRFSFSLTPTTAVSAGSFAGFTWVEPVGTVMPYGIASFGSLNQNFTVGAAFPFIIDNERGIWSAGIVGALAGKIVLNSTVSMLFENWTIYYSREGRWDEPDIFLFPGVSLRIAGSRFSGDIGIVVPFRIFVEERNTLSIIGVPMEDFVPLPLVSITYRIQ